MTRSGFVRRALRKVLASGEWKFHSVNGERVKGEKAIMAEIGAVDDAVVYFKNAQGKQGWFRVVWQGPHDENVGVDEAEETIADASSNIGDIIEDFSARPFGKAGKVMKCDVCGLIADATAHPCQFEHGCSCWRGIPCGAQAQVNPASRKDFVKIAEAIRFMSLDADARRDREVLRIAIAHDIADALATMNPRFDRGRFMSACQPAGTEGHTAWMAWPRRGRSK